MRDASRSFPQSPSAPPEGVSASFRAEGACGGKVLARTCAEAALRTRKAVLDRIRFARPTGFESDCGGRGGRRVEGLCRRHLAPRCNFWMGSHAMGDASRSFPQSPSAPPEGVSATFRAEGACGVKVLARTCAEAAPRTRKAVLDRIRFARSTDFRSDFDGCGVAHAFGDVCVRTLGALSIGRNLCLI